MELARPRSSRRVGITFKGGRVDCPTSPEDTVDHVYPKPTMNRAEMMAWFSGHKDAFNMNEEQVR